MSSIFKQLIIVLLLAGMYGASVAVAQKTGAVIIRREDPTSASIHEGVTGQNSAGFKTNANPLIGQVPASYEPFHSAINAIGSLVLPFSRNAPIEDTASLGFKFTIQQLFPYKYGQKAGTTRLDPGTKGIAGKNITDVAMPGIPGDKGPGGLYWVGYPRPGNVENPPPFQLVHDPYDCFCRWGEQIECPLVESALRHESYGGPWWNTFTVPCQACFVGRIVKHDFYVGTDHGPHRGYPFSFPNDTGYQECLRQSIQSYAASGPGGTPVNDFFGL